MNSDNIKIYDDNAKQLAGRYGALAADKVLPLFTAIAGAYKGTDRAALDIGSGVGRDAAWMADQGWKVDAVDGSKALLAEAEKLNPRKNITYRYDLAPEFNNTRAQEKKYNLILMSAFIFHFEKEERQKILQFCHDILAPSGLVYITLRKGPELAGRSIFDVKAEEITEFSRENGLSVQYHGRGKDGVSPPDIEWDHLSMWRGASWEHAREYTL